MSKLVPRHGSSGDRGSWAKTTGRAVAIHSRSQAFKILHPANPGVEKVLDQVPVKVVSGSFFAESFQDIYQRPANRERRT
jgi:hypothetical protein